MKIPLIYSLHNKKKCAGETSPEEGWGGFALVPGPLRPPKTYNHYLLRNFLVIFLLFYSLSMASGQQGGGFRGQGGRPAGQNGGTPGQSLPIALAETTERYNAISVGGRLKPSTRIDHQAIANGLVLSVSVREGEGVKKDDVLFTIERDDIAGSYKPVIISARVSGIVSEVLVQEKDEVKSGQSGVVIVGTGGFTLEANISDKDAFKVEVGETVTGHTTEGETVQGRLISRSPEPEYSTGLFFLTFQFPENRNAYIGQFVMVDLPVDKVSGVFVNRELLTRRYGGFFLWIVDESNILHAREVKTGPLFGENILIREGLSPGERYLTQLTGREREGMEFGPASQRQNEQQQ